MMRTLDRYVMRNFLHSYVLCLAVMMGLRLGGDLFVNLDDFAEAGRQNAAAMVEHMLTYYALHSLGYFQELAGVVLAGAAAFALARMNHSNELTAVLASGTSMHRVILPVIVVAMGLSSLSLLDQELLIPRFKDRLSLRRSELPETVRLRVQLLQDGRRQIWYSQDYEAITQQMTRPLVLARDEQNMLAARISGRQGQYMGRRRWRFSDGVVVRRPPWTSQLTAPRPLGWQTVTASFVPMPEAQTVLAAADAGGTAAAGELAFAAKGTSSAGGLMFDVTVRVFAEADGTAHSTAAQQPLATLTADLALQGRHANDLGFYLVGPPDVDADDIGDLPALCRRLMADDRRAAAGGGDVTDSFSRRLWLALPASARQRARALAEAPPGQIAAQDRREIAAALTVALHWGRLLKASDVPGSLLTEPMLQSLTEEVTSRLNRLALDLNYEGLIAPSGADLWIASDLTPEEMAIRQKSGWVNLMSTGEINRLLGTGKAPDPAAASMSKHLRIATPVINLVMMLVGIPFILSRERNIRASATLAVAMGLSVYLAALLARQLGAAGLDPVLAAWGPVLVFGPVAVWMLDAVKT